MQVQSSMATPAVLVVDDDPNIRQVLRLYLERERYRVSEEADGPAAVESARHGHFDLIVLDVMLPGLDGMEVCRRIRESSQVPILLLTARSGDSDKVVGLDVGADDYVVKPFSPRELMARVRAQIRRHRPREADAPSLASNGLALDPTAVRVEVDGRAVALTATEFTILHTLMQRPTRVFSRNELIEAVHGNEDPGIVDRTIDVHLGRLRRKLGDGAAQPRFIETVRSVGYRFARPVEQREAAAP
jgi:DNA-binding response OmpR family regulator